MPNPWSAPCLKSSHQIVILSAAKLRLSRESSTESGDLEWQGAVTAFLFSKQPPDSSSLTVMPHHLQVKLAAVKQHFHR